MRDYIIAAPGYDHQSAGIRCLFVLAEKLKAKGFKADTGNRPAGPETVVVYPDIVNENIYRANYYVQWHLNRPEFWGFKRMDAPHFVYTREMAEETEKVLFINPIEQDLFNSKDLPKKDLNTYYIGYKATMIPGHKEVFESTKHLIKGCIEMTRKHPPIRSEVAELLRRTKIFYTWDNFTALSMEAALCGCKVVIIPDGQTDQKRIERSEWGCLARHYYHPELDIEKIEVIKDSEIIYNQIETISDGDLMNFIDFTQEFKNK